MAQPGPAPQPDVSLQQRVAELEKINAEFLRAQQQLEQEFNQKRAKFKELYLAKEEDLKRQNAVLQAAQDDLGHLRTQLWEAQAEMENIKAIATVSENTKQEMKVNLEEQLKKETAAKATVEQLMFEENFDTVSLGSLQMPSGFMLTKDQERAIKAMTPEQEETASLLSSVTQGMESAYVSPSGYRLVSETEWNLLQSAEDSSHQISALVLRAQASEVLLEELQQSFSQAKRDVQEQMAVLMQSREQFSEELVRLQKDNDSLQGKHSLHVSLQLAEDFILPDTVEVLQELVLKYRENIVHVRTAADHMEEKLKAEILFLKEQIQAEQCLKENLEETLQLEIENCKEEIASISSLKAELERIKVEKGQLESTLREKSQQLESLQEMKVNSVAVFS